MALKLVKFVEKGSVTVSDDVATVKNTVLLSDSDLTLAKFILKPSKGNSSVKFESLTMNIPIITNGVNGDDFDVKIGSNTVDAEFSSQTLTVKDESIDIPEAGALVEIIYKNELAAGVYDISLTDVNGKPQTSQTFNKYVVDALVSVNRQVEEKDITKYTFDVDKADDSYTVKNLEFMIDGNYVPIINGVVSDNSTEELAHKSEVKYVDAIRYTYVDGTTATYSCPTNYSLKPSDNTKCEKSTTVQTGSVVVSWVTWCLASDTANGFTLSASDDTKCEKTTTDEVNSNASNEHVVEILKSAYKDFFKVNDTYIKVAKTKD